MSKSLFASSLTRLLDDTTLFDREGWARYLSVPEESIDEWTMDRAVPRADLLRMILDVLRQSTNIDLAVLQAFDEMAQEPAEDVSPLSGYLAPKVAEYLERKTLLGLGAYPQGAPPEEQERALRTGSWRPGPI